MKNYNLNSRHMPEPDSNANAFNFYGEKEHYESDAVEIINEKSGNTLFEKALKLINRVSKLKSLKSRVPSMIDMVKDYIKGNYKRVPYKTIVLIVVGVLYLVNPFDAIPDTIPGVGFIDDAAILGFIVDSVKEDLDKYIDWKTTDQCA